MLDTARFLGAAAVVGNRGNIGDHINVETGGLQDTHGSVAAGAGAFDVDVERVQTGGTSFLQAFLDNGGGGKRSRTASTLEAGGAGGAPTNNVTIVVSETDIGGVESGFDKHLALTVLKSDFVFFFGGHFVLDSKFI